jgi:hypothetical protein
MMEVQVAPPAINYSHSENGAKPLTHLSTDTDSRHEIRASIAATSTSSNYKPPFKQNPKNGAKEEICSNCKKAGHNREGCWWLHPQLRPKSWKSIKKGGGGNSLQDGRKGEHKRQREITSGKRESQCLSSLEGTQNKRGDHEAATGEMTHSDSSEFDMDQMRWLYTQLSVMLQGKNQKTSGIVTNFAQNSLNSNEF